MLRNFLRSPVQSGLARLFCQAPTSNSTVDFVQRDFDEMKKLDLRMQYDSAYLKIMDAWQKPLEKKHRRQKRIAEIKSAFVA